MWKFRRMAMLGVFALLALSLFGCALFNTAPVASFTLDSAAGAAPLTVTVNASGSVDPDGDILTYQWSFGDGTFGTGVTTDHTYTAEGQYTLTLTVRDAGGLETTIQRTVLVTGTSESPVASFTASPSSGGTPLTVAFNASASMDPNGSIVSYFWSFGDGSTGTGVSPLHTYSVQGTYSAMLTVTDNDGLKDSLTLVILVVDGGQGGCS